MTHINFEKAINFKIGDTFYECEYGINICATVISIPLLYNNGVDNRRTLKWFAKNTENDSVIEYFMTEGLETYGPRLYAKPQYIKIREDGSPYFPLFGAKEESED